MALQEPVAVFTAASNLEAQMVKILLVEAGIEAFATEDFSAGGYWAFGTLPGIHKPQVWVSAEYRERAEALVAGYEEQKSEKRQQALQNANASGTIEVRCEDCDRSTTYPAAQRGSVQDCPHCGAFVDVGDPDESDPWWRDVAEPEE